jgi:hypothetical protein
MLLVATGCTTSPMMPDIMHIVDGSSADDSAEAGVGNASDTRLTVPKSVPVRRTDTEKAARNPFAITTKGQEIERSLGIDH